MSKNKPGDQSGVCSKVEGNPYGGRATHAPIAEGYMREEVD